LINPCNDSSLIRPARLGTQSWPTWFKLIPTWPEHCDNPDLTWLDSKSDWIGLSLVVIRTKPDPVNSLGSVPDYDLQTWAFSKLDRLNLVSFKHRPELVQFLQGTGNLNRLGRTQLNAFIWWSGMSLVIYSPLRVTVGNEPSKSSDEQPLGNELSHHDEWAKLSLGSACACSLGCWLIKK